MNSFLKSIRNHINNDQIEIALQKLRELLENSPLLDEAILKAAQFNDLRREIRRDTISREEANEVKHQIRAGLLDLLCEIDQLEEQPDIRQEVERAISIINSKNVVVGKIHAGGSIHIGDQYHNSIKGNNNTIIQGVNSGGDTNITIGKSDRDGK